MNIREKADKLKEYAMLENSELGEYLHGLIFLSKRLDMASGDFEIALEKEIDNVYNYCILFAQIVEVEETITNKFKKIEWLDGC